MSIAINSNFERDQLVASFTGQVIFNYSFPIFSQTYLHVYQYSAATPPFDTMQLLTLGVDYTVQGVGEEAGGTITLTVGATAGDIITIIGAQPIERLTVFEDLNPFTVALNQQLNGLTVMIQQVWTILQNTTPSYNFDELVSAPTPSTPQGVRPRKLKLPMLPDGYVWVGRGTIGSNPDDIVAMPYLGVPGMGNVTAQHAGMRPSITVWDGTDFVITDSNLNIVGELITPTAGQAANLQTGFDNSWGAMHWPAHATGGRPVAPQNGDTYYDTTTNQFFGYIAGVWTPFGAGSPGAITFTFTQAPVVPPLYMGAAVRVDAATGNWVCTLGDTTLDAEFYAFVVGISGSMYTIQYVGMPPVGIPAFTGLAAGTPMYLSDTVPGGITAIPPAASGHINYPVLWVIDGVNTVIRMSRGFINGGQMGNTPTPPNNVLTVVQPGNTFVKGNVLFISSDATFSLAHARTFLAAQGEWVVTSVVIANNTFTIQQGGSLTGVITTSNIEGGGGVVSAVPYYLSPTVGQEGNLTLVEPTGPGLWSKPVYQQQIGASNTGWLLDQRPVLKSASGNVFLGVLNNANNFSNTTILQGFNAYEILLIDPISGPPGTGGIYAAGGGLATLGFQWYCGGAFVTSNAYSHYLLGVNSTANPTTTGVIYSAVNNTSTESSAIIFPAVTTAPVMVNLKGILTVTGGGNGAYLQHESWSVDNANPANPIGYTAAGWTAGAGAGALTGLRVFVGGGATITPGTQSYFAIWGIPNS